MKCKKVSNNNILHYYITQMDWNLSQYKDIFGKPMAGVHSYRFFNVAIVDVAATIIAAWLISYYGNYSFVYTLAFLCTDYFQ